MPVLNTSAPVATNIPQGGGSGAEKIALFPVVMLPLMGVAFFLLLFLHKFDTLFKLQGSAFVNNTGTSEDSTSPQSTIAAAGNLLELDVIIPPKLCKELRLELLKNAHPLWAELDSNMACAVCLERLVDTDMVRQLPCGHTFHSGCIAAWYLAGHNSCPVCTCDFVIASPPLQKPCQAHL
ncbi:hypothetical protein NXS19_013042 [Fusarium pseudograminearum]|nr:hypothetical protein NXS19_013042 [Fusarium pseudograminearum]